MEIHKLQEIGGRGSAGVTLPKRFLREDGVVGPDGVDENCHVRIDHTGNGRYELQLVGIDE